MVMMPTTLPSRGVPARDSQPTVDAGQLHASWQAVFPEVRRESVTKVPIFRRDSESLQPEVVRALVADVVVMAGRTGA